MADWFFLMVMAPAKLYSNNSPRVAPVAPVTELTSTVLKFGPGRGGSPFEARLGRRRRRRRNRHSHDPSDHSAATATRLTVDDHHAGARVDSSAIDNRPRRTVFGQLRNLPVSIPRHVQLAE